MVRCLTKLFLFFSILSLVYNLYLVYRFNYSVMILPLNLMVLSLIFGGCYVIMGFLYSLKKVRTGKYSRFLVMLVPSLLTFIISFLYAIDLVINFFWQRNFSLEFFYYVWANLGIFESNTGVHLNIVLITAAVMFSVACLIFMVCSRRIWKDFGEDFNGSVKSFSVKILRKTVLILMVLVIIYLVMLVVLSIKFPENYKDKNDRDPIISFFSQDFVFKRYMIDIDPIEKNTYLESIYSGDGNGKNLIFIFLDSARASDFSMYGYYRNTTPFLQDEYQSGEMDKVDYAFSTCSESVCGILSSFSSKERRFLNIYNVSQEIFLPSILKKAGYENYVISSAALRANKWGGIQEFLNNETDFFMDETVRINNSYLESSRKNLRDTGYAGNISIWTGKPGDTGLADDRRVLIALGNIPVYNGTPAFMYIHTFSSHHGGYRNEKFQVFKPSDSYISVLSLIAGELDKDMLTNRYDNGLVQTDYYVSQIFDILGKKGYLNHSVVFILGDHGEAIGEKGYFAHSFHMYNEEMRVPLLIYSSPKIEIKNLKFASSIDLAPTSLDILGIPKPLAWQGSSLLDSKIKEYSVHQPAFVNSEKVVILRKENKMYKYYYFSGKDPFFDKSARQEIYELYSDPFEKINLMGIVQNEVYEALKDRLISSFEMVKES